MSQRVNVMLESDSDQKAIIETLRSSGVDILRSRVDPGDVLVIDIPDSMDLNVVLDRLRVVPGVRSAEPDSWQSII